MRLGFKIAKKFLKSNRGQTMLIILGIAIGVSVQIFIGSLIQGLQKSLVEKTIGNSPQIVITPNTDVSNITDYDNIIEKINSMEDNVTKISVADDHAAALLYKDTSQSMLIRGFDIKEADKIYNFIDRLEEGTYPKDKNEIILGVQLKEEIGIQLNDVVTVVTTEQKSQELIVVGFYDLKVSSINKSWAITTLETTNELFGSSGTVTSIEIQVDSNATFEVDTIATQIKENLNNPNLKFDHWKNQNEQLLSGLQGQSISSIMIQVFVLVSVVLGIASVLAITVMQKSKQLGILKAMGIKNSVSSYIFIFEGLLLGLFGAVLGIVLGFGLSLAFTTFALNPDGTPVVALYFSTPFILMSALIAVASSVLAALIPAIRSFKLNPIDIIRNN